MPRRYLRAGALLALNSACLSSGRMAKILAHHPCAVQFTPFRTHSSTTVQIQSGAMLTPVNFPSEIAMFTRIAIDENPLPTVKGSKFGGNDCL